MYIIINLYINGFYLKDITLEIFKIYIIFNDN